MHSYIYVFTTPKIVDLNLIYEPSNYLGAVQLLAKKNNLFKNTQKH